MNISNLCINGFIDLSTSLPIDRRIFVNPNNNSIGNSRYINPVTGDYLFNSNGKIAGLIGMQQAVYLSLVTVLGSSAVISLGQTYSTIQVITQNFNQDIQNSVNLALANLINNGSISLDNVSVTKKSNSVELLISWTDNTITLSQSNLLNYGGPKVAVPQRHSTSPNLGLSPGQIVFLEAWYRADQGIDAPNSILQGWYDQSGVVDKIYDSNRNALQTTIADQPLFIGSNSDFNYKPIVNFSGSDQLTTGNWNDGYIGLPTTIFMIMEWTDNSSNYVAFDGSDNDFYFENDHGMLKINAGSNATGSSASTGVQAYILVFNGNQSYYQQSSFNKSNFSGDCGNNMASGLTIGNITGSNMAGSSIAELAVFAGELSGYYRDNLMVYAHNKYSIEIN